MSEEHGPDGTGNGVGDAATLSQQFDNAFEMFNKLKRSQEATNSPKIQADIKRTMNMLEDTTRLVSIVDMFSENESFEEVATENIKYFLLPALLGTLTTQLCGSADRMHVVSVAEIYFVDFLKRTKAYGLTDIDIPEHKHEQKQEDNLEESNEGPVVRTRSNAELITEMVVRRNTKLQRYRERKDLESSLETLQRNMENPNVDDEIKREFFVNLIKLYINLAIDELSWIASERPILEHSQRMSKSNTLESEGSRRPKAKLQPIIITRDEVQKKVYGAGYPSLPVLTVEEFYEQRVKDGDWPAPSERNQMNAQSLQDMAKTDGAGNTQEENDAIEKENKIEADDEAQMNQMRAMDEYKDMHRRGWGNRANRS